MRYIRKRMLLRFDDVPIVEDVYMRDEYRINEILLAKKAEFVVDVGAHVGAFTLKVADTMGAAAQIIAIEPHPENAAILRLNRERTIHPDGIHVVEAALTHEGPKTVFLTDKLGINTGGSVVRGTAQRKCGDDGPGAISVMSAYLPTVLDVYKFPRVDLLKFDCEGCEFVGLQSLKDTGWLEKIKWIRGEFHGHLGGAVEKLLKDTHTVVLYNKSGALGKFAADKKRYVSK